MQPIIKNMPIPPLKRRGAKAKYPWAEIQPGQAFKFDESASMAGASSLAYQSGRQHKKKFAVRQMDDGIWCWRVDGTPYAAANGNYRPVSDVVDNYGDTASPALETNIVGDPDVI